MCIKGGVAMKQFLLSMIAVLLLPFFPAQPEENPVTLRALLIGGDTFFSQPATHPIAENNLQHMESLLSSDARTYDTIHTYYEEISNTAAFENAVQHAFSAADENDISLVYFSTHGIMDDDKTGLFLCDHMEENLLSPATLANALSAVPGQKILLLDACNSGAFIAKGVEDLSVSHPFTGKNIAVITSAGGLEASWQWLSSRHTSGGGSYFAALLNNGLGGHHQADINRDENITLQEAFQYLLENSAASVPQCYLTGCRDVPLYQYSKDSAFPPPVLSDLTFEDTLLSSDNSDLHFSFTIHQETTLYYQLVYYKDGRWDFDNAAFFQDVQEGEGPLSPGRKQRTLSFSTQSREDSGYVMIHLFSMQDEMPVYQGGRLLCVQPSAGEVQLSVTTAPAFTPAFREEMSILVYHDVPCSLSVTVRSPFGKTIRRLSYAQPTRPQQLSQSASTFSWDGLDQQGNMAEAGQYYIQVQVTLGERRFSVESAPFTLSLPPSVQ